MGVSTMKQNVKLSIVLMVLSLTTTSSFADIVGPPVPGVAVNGELILFVSNYATGEGYARGLVTQIDGIRTQADIVADTYVPGAEYISDFNLGTIKADNNLSAFLESAQNSGTTNSIVWSVIGGSGGSSLGVGVQRYVTTTPLSSISNPVRNTQLRSNFSNSLSSFVRAANQAIGTGVVGDGSSTPVASFPFGFYNSGAESWNGVMPAMGDIGTTIDFYMLTSAGGSSVAPSRYYQLNSIELQTNGDLVMQPSAVPIPAAIWLLGSGLLGFLGVGRRRNV